MSDCNDLKRLAEAAPGGPWIAENDSIYFKDDGYTRHLLDADAGHDVEDEAYYAALKFIAAANPAAVLALIAENEQLELIGRIAYNFDGYKAVLDERDQLKAENAGLKTGYEAYERVNAELKAENERLAAHIADGMDHKAVAVKGMARLTTENEALRKDADRYQWLRDKSEAINQFYLSVPLWFSGVRFRKEDVDSGIDAAMGQGGESNESS